MKLNEKATKENLEAAIKLLSKMKRTPGYNWKYRFDFGGIQNCKLCFSAGVKSHLQTKNCKNCILTYKEKEIKDFNDCGCYYNDEWNDIFDKLYDVNNKKTKINAFKLIRKNIPEFIKLCEKNNITIPKIIVNF